MTRTWIVVFIVFLALILGIWAMKHQWNHPTHIPPINDDNYKVIGIIDLDNKHQGPDYQSVKDGIDPVLAVDHTQPFYGQLMAKNPETANDPYSDIFRLQIYDENNDGFLDNQDPIWTHLHILVYNSETKTYEIKPLEAAGIRAILLKHLTKYGNHMVILSNGAERTLYEVTKWTKKP